MQVEILEENDNLYMVDKSMTVNEINGSGEHEWNFNLNLVNQFGKIEDTCIDINDSMNVMMYDNNITKKDSMYILINKSKSLNIKFNNDGNVSQNEGIIIDDLDINRLNTHIEFVMVEISLE